MGREQTQKFGKKTPPVESTTPPNIPVTSFQEKFPLGNPRGKTTGFNVFGIGGTTEYPNPYKNQAQKDFASFTQQITSNIFGGVSPFTGKNLQVPSPASPTGNGNGQCVEEDPTCGVKEFFAGVPAGTYCKCPSWWGNGTTTETKCECEACKNGTGACSNKKPCCNAWDVLCEMGGECSKPKPPDEECDIGCFVTGRGCDCGCKDVKPCTTCDSTVCAECNAWDLQCEDCKKKDGTCTPPTGECGCLPFDIGCKIGCWWEKNKNYVYIIGGIIGLGILPWLLRPLFGIAKNITEP